MTININKVPKLINCVYKITNPTGLIYIGSTTKLKNRFRQYRGLYCKDQPALYNSFCKHGIEAHTFEVLEHNIKLEDLFKRERFWGDYYNTIATGLNCQLPGYDDVPQVISEETRDKLRQNQIWQRQHNPNMYSNPNIGAIAKARFAKTIINLDTGEKFLGCTEAAKSVGENRSAFQKRLVGKRPNKYNIWYEEDIINNNIEALHAKLKALHPGKSRQSNKK